MSVDFLKKCFALSIEEPDVQTIQVQLEYNIQATLRIKQTAQLPADYCKKDIDSAVANMLDNLRGCDSDYVNNYLDKPIDFDKLEAPKEIDIIDE
jgi:hypothetical protein